MAAHILSPSGLVFVGFVLVWIGVATALLMRSPFYGWGLPMFVLLYPVFLVAWFFLSAGVLMTVWLVLAVLNMGVQAIFIQGEGRGKLSPGILIASLFLWPIQFGAVIHNVRGDAIADVEKAAARDSIGPLPASICGVVSYTHHLDIDTGYDAVWLEEYGELQFITEAALFDKLRIAEGRRMTFTVDERDAPKDLATGKTLWITGGETDSDG